MEIREMNIEEVQGALDNLVEEINATEEPTEETLERMNADLEALEARKAELKEIATKTAEEARAVVEGAGEIVETFTKETEMEARTFAVDTMEYRNAWLKNLMGKDIDAEERGAITATDAIPTITQNLIINRLKENALLSKIDLLQIPGYVRFPVYSTNGDAAWATTNEQEDVIGHIDLTPFQLIKTIEVPGTVDQMSIDAFEAYIVEALANKLESALQKAVIIGTGSSQPTGIAVTHSTADGTFTKAGITKKDLLGIMGALDAKYMKDAVWIMPNAVLYEAMAIADLNGFGGVAEGIGYQIGGKPVVVDDNCIISSTDTIFFGGAKAYHMNLGEGVKVDKDTSVGFKSNAVNYRGVCLADGKLDNADAFVKYTRATA